MIKVYGGKKAKYVAENVDQKPAWVVSILSDERLPNQLIIDLFSINLKSPLIVYMLGDFINTKKDFWKASKLLIEMLQSRFDNKIILVKWYDGDSIDFVSKLHDIGSEKINCLGSYETFLLKYSLKEDGSDFLSVIKEYDDSGRCTSACFSLKEPFVYELLPLRFQVLLHQKIAYYSSSPSLKIIEVPFCGLKIFKVPDQLEHLDIRGNESVKLEFNESNSRLRHLNMSACGLSNISEKILNLPELRTFLAYKNFINEINISSLKQAKRISLYRNNISFLELNYENLPELIELNIGANPISNLIQLNLNRKNKFLKINSLKCFKLINFI